jgi:Ca-activated chloride channel family protein
VRHLVPPPHAITIPPGCEDSCPHEEAWLRVEWSWSAGRRHLASVVALLAVAALVATAARPSVALGPTRRQGTVELVVDVSASTQADDVAPTRMGAIQRATMRLIDRLPPQVLVGLISFSGEVRALARPTGDRAAVKGKIERLTTGPSTAIGDALIRALDDLQASRPAGPVWLLLISDGANTAGVDPDEGARLAGQRHVPILAVALGTPDGTVEVKGQLIPVPPDLEQLTSIARESGGKALAAQSAPELEEALADLLRFTGLEGEQRDLTMPFAAATLLLLAIAGALRPAPGLAAPDLPARRTPNARRWTSVVALLLAAGVTVISWTLWLPAGAAPPVKASETAETGAASAASAVPLLVLPAAPSPAPYDPTADVSDEAATDADRRTIERATELLHDHRLLAQQRTAEIDREHLMEIGGLDVTACDECAARFLTSSSTGSYAIPVGSVCFAELNLPFIKQQAKTAHLSLRALMAMVLLHEQEVCMRTPHGRLLLFDAERRLAARLHEPLLLDVVYAQIDARRRDWPVVEEAVAILRRHGELAYQRGDGLRRHHRNQVGPLQIGVCRGCGDDWIGEASAGYEFGGAVSCDIRLDLSGIEQTARDYGLPAVLMAASTLIHEQEHCVRSPDYRERPAVDAEHRFAIELGDARLLSSVQDEYGQLDSRGYWKS